MPKEVNKRGAGHKRGKANFPLSKEMGTPAERQRRPLKQNAESAPALSVQRAALYLRMSSERNAQSVLPVSKQKAQIEEFCRGKSWLAKTVSALFDEYQSRHPAIESMRARRKMVVEGYWPGGRPPYGYKLVPANDNPLRNVLAVDAEESSLVEKIFSFARCGEGGSAPMGIRAIAAWLNTHGFRTRGQSRWGIRAIHHLLTNTVYCGMYYWGVRAKETDFQGVQTPLSLHVPPIIPQEEFDAVQRIIGTS